MSNVDGRRFFERLEERVLRLDRQFVGRVDDEHAPRALERSVTDHIEHPLAKRLDLDGCLITLVEHDDVRMRAGRDSPADGTGTTARRHRPPAGQLTACASARATVALADAVRTGEEQALRHPSARDGLAQQVHQVTVPDDVGKRHGVRSMLAKGGDPVWPARLRGLRRRCHNRVLPVGAVSSVVEHRPYTPAVTGSNPVPPTTSAIQHCGVVVQLVRTLACHARGREFESRRPRHFSQNPSAAAPVAPVPGEDLMTGRPVVQTGAHGEIPHRGGT